MSKISDYNLRTKEDVLSSLIAVCDLAVRLKDFTIWFGATAYALGIREIASCYMDDDVIKVTDQIINEYEEKMNEIRKKEDLN